MANIKSHGGSTIAQVRMCPEGNQDQWVTLTVTSDGRLLRKITFANHGTTGTWYSNSNNKVMGKVPETFMAHPRDRMERALTVVAKNLGYTEVKVNR